ncbi:tRNA (N6-threonylcarbamoyladenosine(37)-N6)-methyltransferase TrmO [Marinomonas piezotolerans]|uniref:tRNA (N6-threonylcarbamoyladenosine(37)-N6)-methyltransferase TrmO n=1 Tax=Marinomonas piezotolerans TaxID=2213058 RepID=A0A370U7X0_9GAMM|nr:tRNA (N6-threonylcarbamoyladenosine(37)-N6)-methyltransferase TrmO [Marinomonas piezotolerans]RDL43864.1 tRNA (N6-threonylcarbamoyladenosine(37)-N6)-methyltransferase TrmO [Marinomonas piezotolerans]
MSKHFQFQQIGIVHSCYKEKFGIPRQPGLVTESSAAIELLPPYNRADTLDGLEGFSHIWVHFVFHQCIQENWKAKVRPPRLGGKKKVGVFASRATHRPNPIGLSVVALNGIRIEGKRVFIDILGIDLLDQTPVLDIKPYLPYADSLPNATGGFAPTPAPLKPVHFTELAQNRINVYKEQYHRDLRPLIEQVIGQDPRPSYLISKLDKKHGNKLWNTNVIWTAKKDGLWITDIEFPEEVNNEQVKNAQRLQDCE